MFTDLMKLNTMSHMLRSAMDADCNLRSTVSGKPYTSELTIVQPTGYKLRSYGSFSFFF